MRVDSAVFYLVDEDKKIVQTYLSDDEEDKKEKSFNLGIIGKTIQKQEYTIINNPKENPDVNEIVDISTNLPIITMPVIEELFEKKKGDVKVCKAIYQVIFNLNQQY